MKLYVSLLICLFNLPLNVSAGQIIFHRPPEYQSFYHLLPECREAETIDLNGEWSYLAGTNKGGKTLLPASFSGYEGEITFSRTFRLDGSDTGKPVSLVLFGVSNRCIVKVNDEIAGNLTAGSAKLPISPELLNYGQNNVLEITVDNSLHPTNSIPLRNGIPKPENYGGLTGDIFLTVNDFYNVRDVIIVTEYERSKGVGKIALNLEFDLPVLLDVKGILKYEVFDPDDKTVYSVLDRNTLKSVIDKEIIVENPRLWNFLKPDLYNLQISLIVDDAAELLINRKVGFKSADYNNGFILNGSKLQIKGITYYPVGEFGKTFTRQSIKNDVELIIRSGANAVMLTEPAQPYFYHICDSLGLPIFQSAILSGIPASVMARETMDVLSQNYMKRMFDALSGNPSISAWILGRNCLADFPLKKSSEYTRSRSEVPCFMEIHSIPGYLVYYNNDTGEVLPTTIYSDIGVCRFGGQGESETQYTEKYLAKLIKYKTSEGVFLKSFADYKSGRALLFAGGTDRKNICQAGITGINHNETLLFRQLQNGWFNDQIALPTADKDNGPIFFPAGGLAIVMLLLLYYRNNKIFRMQFSRVFAHLHGFAVDVRSGRFIQKMQTTVIGGGAALILAFLLETLLHSLRYTQHLDYLIGHLFPNSVLQKSLITLIWTPAEAVPVFFILILLLIYIGAVFFKLTDAFLGGKTDLIKCFILLQWSLAPILLLTPLTVIFYRGLSYQFLRMPLLILLGLFLAWSYIRIAYSIKVTARTTMLKSLIFFGVLNLAVIGVFAGYFQYRAAIFYYWGYLTGF